MKRTTILSMCLVVVCAVVLVGCDANVKDTVLAGVETGTQAVLSALIQAFFSSLSDTSTAMLDAGVFNAVGLFA